MPLPKHIEHLRKRPSMHLRVVTYDTVAACLHGFDLADNGAFLGDFQAWLCTQTARGHNMGWSTLVLYLAFPESQKPWNELSLNDSNNHAIDVLFQSLEDFVNQTTGETHTLTNRDRTKR